MPAVTPPNRSTHVLGVIGVRDFKNVLYENKSYIVRTVEHHLEMKRIPISGVKVVTGGGKGVEEIIIKWCEAKGIDLQKIPPNIQQFGPKKAFTVRNNHIVTQCTELVVFWDGCIDITSESIITAMHLSKVATVYPVI